MFGEPFQVERSYFLRAKIRGENEKQVEVKTIGSDITGTDRVSSTRIFHRIS